MERALGVSTIEKAVLATGTDDPDAVAGDLFGNRITGRAHVGSNVDATCSWGRGLTL